MRLFYQNKLISNLIWTCKPRNICYFQLRSIFKRISKDHAPNSRGSQCNVKFVESFLWHKHISRYLESGPHSFLFPFHFYDPVGFYSAKKQNHDNESECEHAFDSNEYAASQSLQVYWVIRLEIVAINVFYYWNNTGWIYPCVTKTLNRRHIIGERKTKKHDFWNDAEDSMKKLLSKHEIIDVYAQSRREIMSYLSSKMTR